MPKMKAFDCPLFPLQTADEKNLADVEAILGIVSEKLTIVDDGLDTMNAQLKETHLGHEAHLWGQEVEGQSDEGE